MRTDLDFCEHHTLEGGLVVAVRHLRPSDAGELQRAFQNLSPESRYRRFFGNEPELSDAALHYLTSMDGRDHVALIALTDSPDLKTERGLGVARFVRIAGASDVAEASVAVLDLAQRRGVGRCLLETLVVAASERGVVRFRAEVLSSNEPMRKILSEVEASIVSDDGTVIVFDVPLHPLSSLSSGSSPVAQLLRAAAGSFGDMLRGWMAPENLGKRS